MARRYQCRDCKRPFQNQFALTAHIRFCRNKNKAKCPECGKLCKKSGIGSHRLAVHGVAGTSRWSVKARAGKKPHKGGRDVLAHLVKSFLKKPFFQEILKEWALHVEDAIETKTVDATTFANLYLEMMRDPRNDEARQGCAAFATFMKPRNWKKIFECFKGALGTETLATFEKPEAEIFYKQFRHMILEQITEYWEQFLTDKTKEEPVAIPQSTATWKDQAIKAATDKIEFYTAQIKKLEDTIQVIRELS